MGFLISLFTGIIVCMIIKSVGKAITQTIFDLLDARSRKSTWGKK